MDSLTGKRKASGINVTGLSFSSINTEVPCHRGVACKGHPLLNGC